ncbi:MAG TPA: family 16 glycosylhydrolase [Nocardioides sp.]|nr:family 16 glycosylhydrolase [Nocardioides sp.]
MTGRFARGAAVTALLVLGPALAAPGVAEAPGSARDGAGASQTASQKYGWGKSLWDFAYQYGESLSDPPHRGTDRKHGSWTESTDGSGRAVKWGGGLQIESSGQRRGDPGDHGTASLTLHDQPETYGRWETRHRSDAIESSDQPYRDLIQLVPAGGGCDHTITIADLDPNGETVTIAVNAGGQSWKRTFKGYEQGRDFPRNYGVEVTKKKISWFIDGKVVGTLTDKAAIPKDPMTVRLSLAGEGSTERNHTTLLFDWVRGWDLAKGKNPPKGPAVKAGSYDDAC